MKFASRVRFLEIYSGVLTAAFSITVFGGFAEPRRAACDEIDVHRINVVEPDSMLRMAIADKAKLTLSYTERKLRGRTGTVRDCYS